MTNLSLDYLLSNSTTAAGTGQVSPVKANNSNSAASLTPSQSKASDMVNATFDSGGVWMPTITSEQGTCADDDETEPDIDRISQLGISPSSRKRRGSGSSLEMILGPVSSAHMGMRPSGSGTVVSQRKGPRRPWVSTGLGLQVMHMKFCAKWLLLSVTLRLQGVSSVSLHTLNPSNPLSGMNHIVTAEVPRGSTDHSSSHSSLRTVTLQVYNPREGRDGTWVQEMLLTLRQDRIAEFMIVDELSIWCSQEFHN